MVNRNICLSLLVLVVIASGCTDGPSQTQSEGTGSITIHQLQVEPQQIYQGSSVRVLLDIANTGRFPARMDAGENGENVLLNYCPDIFTNEPSGYQVTPSDAKLAGDTYRLQPSQELKIRWLLKQEGKVPLIGYDCNLKLEVPFDYKVSAFRQIQIKQSRTIEGTTNLESKSSSGPLRMAVELIGGSGEEGPSTLVAGEDQSVRVLLQLQNLQSENYAKGTVDIREETLRIKAPMLGIDEGFEEDGACGSGTVCEGDTAYKWTSYDGEKDCNLDRNEHIRMFEGESRVITCDAQVPESMDEPSIVSEIEAEVNYTYSKDAGRARIEVETRGQ